MMMSEFNQSNYIKNRQCDFASPFFCRESRGHIENINKLVETVKKAKIITSLYLIEPIRFIRKTDVTYSEN